MITLPYIDLLNEDRVKWIGSFTIDEYIRYMDFYILALANKLYEKIEFYYYYEHPTFFA